MADAATLPAAQESQPDPAMEDVSKLVQWRDAAEEATLDARKLSERDRDYYDNKQLTAAEIQTLKKRGQPIVIKNKIKNKIDYLCGLEKKQRAGVKATPKTPIEQDGAFAVKDAIRYEIDKQQYNFKRSQTWRNIIVEGYGGVDVCVEPKDGYYCICINRCPWDRIFYDPHSAEADFSDAMYLGIDTWMDESDARSKYEGVENLDEILSATYQMDSRQTDTYDDKPKHGVWADKSRKRLRISQMYFRPNGVWHYAEFTKGGMLKGGVSPYLNEDGEPDCGFVFQSAFVDRDNNRYGAVREMIGPQDEVNKRSSKALHLFTMRQVRIDPRAGLDPQKVRKETARADGIVEAAKDEFEILPTGDMAAGHYQLLQEAKNDLAVSGANADLMGDNQKSPSGRAIQLNQTGGLIELSDIMDGLRHFDYRVFKAVWNRIRQFWPEDKWIDVTDDPRNVRYVGFNVTPATRVRLMSTYPDGLPGNISVVERPVAQIAVDIGIESAPDTIEPEREQFANLVELAKAGVPVPPRLVVESIPNLRNKEKVAAEMEEMQNKPDPEVAKAQAELQMQAQRDEAELARKEREAQLDAVLRQAEQEQKMRFAAMEHAQRMQQQREEHEQEMELAETKASIQNAAVIAKANTQNKAAASRAESRTS